MLQLGRVSVDIQTSQILRDVSLQVGEQELVCLVGRNGAGKTTTLRTIMGYARPRAGTITYRDRSLLDLPPHARARLGLGFAPEDSGIFGDLTVAENIEMATWTRPEGRPAAVRIEEAYAVFPKLRSYGPRGGNQLSGGERKMLSIARALALDPALLLLDEPFEGLSPPIIPLIMESIGAITRLGRSLLLAESNIHHVPEFATRLYVIERGEIIYAGRPSEVQKHPEVLRVIGGAI